VDRFVAAYVAKGVEGIGDLAAQLVERIRCGSGGRLGDGLVGFLFGVQLELEAE